MTSLDFRAPWRQDPLDLHQGSGGGFRPNGLNQQIKKFGYEKLSQIFDPEQLQALSNIDTLSQSLGKTQKILGGSQTAFSNRILAELGILAANPLVGAKLLLGDALFSKFIGSDLGQRIATKGVKTPGIAKTGKLIMKTAQDIGSKPAALRQAGIAQQEVSQL